MAGNIRVRVGGLALEDGKLFLVEHQKEGKSYYLLPGGGVEFGESFEQALKREWMEEVNLEVQVGRLLYLTESIAPDNSRHVIQMIYRIESFSGDMKVAVDHRLKSGCWMSQDEFRAVGFYPEMQKELLEDWQKGFDSMTMRTIPNRWRD